MPQVKVHKEVAARKDNFFFILSCRHLRVPTILLNTHTHTEAGAYNQSSRARNIPKNKQIAIYPHKENIFSFCGFFIFLPLLLEQADQPINRQRLINHKKHRSHGQNDYPHGQTCNSNHKMGLRRQVADLCTRHPATERLRKG